MSENIDTRPEGTMVTYGSSIKQYIKFCAASAGEYLMGMVMPTDKEIYEAIPLAHSIEL